MHQLTNNPTCAERTGETTCNMIATPLHTANNACACINTLPFSIASHSVPGVFELRLMFRVIQIATSLHVSV